MENLRKLQGETSHLDSRTPCMCLIITAGFSHINKTCLFHQLECCIRGRRRCFRKTLFYMQALNSPVVLLTGLHRSLTHLCWLCSSTLLLPRCARVLGGYSVCPSLHCRNHQARPPRPGNSDMVYLVWILSLRGRGLVNGCVKNAPTNGTDVSKSLSILVHIAQLMSPHHSFLAANLCAEVTLKIFEISPWCVI